MEPSERQKRAFFRIVERDFRGFYKPVKPLTLEALAPTAERKQKRNFSKWLKDFRERGGFEVLWRLKSDYGIDPGTIIIRLTWFRMADFQWEGLRNRAQAENLQRQFGKKIGRRRVIQKFENSARDLEDSVGIINGITLFLLKGDFPHRERFPVSSLHFNGFLKQARSVSRDLRRVADWVKNLPDVTRGPQDQIENGYRARHICGILKGYLGQPLYKYGAELLSCAFPERFPSRRKDTMVKFVRRALRHAGDESLPEYDIPLERRATRKPKPPGRRPRYQH